MVPIQSGFVSTAWVGLRLMAAYRALALGADPALIGLLTATMAVPAFFGAIPIGRISDRVGGALVAVIGISAMTLGIAVVILVPDLTILLVMSAIISCGQLATMIGQQAFVASVSSLETRDADFGTLTASTSLGQLLGAPLVTTAVGLVATGRAVTVGDTSVGLCVTFVCVLLALPVALFIVNRRRDRRVAPTQPTRSGTVHLLKTPGLWKGLAASGAVLATLDLIYAYVPVWAIAHAIPVGVVGWLLALRAVVSLSSRIGLTRLVRRFGRKRLLLVALSIGAVSLVGLSFSNVWTAIPVMIGLGIALGLPQPLTMTWVVSIARREDHGQALGLRMTANRLGQMVVPVAASALAVALGVAGVFWMNALLLGAAVAATVTSDPDAGRRGPAAGDLPDGPTGGADDGEPPR